MATVSHSVSGSMTMVSTHLTPSRDSYSVRDAPMKVRASVALVPIVSSESFAGGTGAYGHFVTGNVSYLIKFNHFNIDSYK